MFDFLAPTPFVRGLGCFGCWREKKIEDGARILKSARLRGEGSEWLGITGRVAPSLKSVWLTGGTGVPSMVTLQMSRPLK